MYCKYCGAPIANDSKFCPNCGQGLTEDSPTASPAEEVTIAKEKPKAQEDAFETNEEVTEEIPNGKAPQAGENIPAEKETAKEEPRQGEIPSFIHQAPPCQINNDPFTGPAHPSMKKNIIIAGVIIGVATIISIVLMAIGIASIVTSGVLQENKTAMESYENGTFPSQSDGTDTLLPNDVDLVDAGNTVGNAVNGGVAVDDGLGGVYYADLDAIYHRSADGDITHITGDNGDSYSNINLKNNCLYYVINFADSSKQQIMAYDLDTATETEITTTEKEVYYMMIYGDALYYATDLSIFAMDLASKEIRTAYTSESSLYDVFVKEDGIYFAITEDEREYTLYRVDYDGSNRETITDGYLFCSDANSLYAVKSAADGSDILCKRNDYDKTFDEVYRFENGSNFTYVTQMQVKDNVLYCITETSESTGDISYEVRAIDLNSGDKSIIDKDFTSDENPFYNLNIGGSWLFYYDVNFSYGLHVYELPM